MGITVQIIHCVNKESIGIFLIKQHDMTESMLFTFDRNSNTFITMFHIMDILPFVHCRYEVTSFRKIIQPSPWTVRWGKSSYSTKSNFLTIRLISYFWCTHIYTSRHTHIIFLFNALKLLLQFLLWSHTLLCQKNCCRKCINSSCYIYTDTIVSIDKY